VDEDQQSASTEKKQEQNWGERMIAKTMQHTKHKYKKKINHVSVLCCVMIQQRTEAKSLNSFPSMG